MATRPMLRSAGLGRRAVDRLIDTGVVEVLYERVLHIVSSRLTIRGRCAALCLAYPSGFITGPVAGRFIELRRMPKRAPIDLAIAHGHPVGPLPGVRLRQSRQIADLDLQARRPDGIRLASASRLMFDLGRDLSAQDHASVVEQLLRDGRCTYAEMLATARRLIHPRRLGSVIVAGTLEARRGRRPVDSHPELVLADALRASGVPAETPQHWLDLPDGGRARLDIAVPAIRWGIEVDVHPDHLLLEGTTRDKKRDRQCHLIGWQIERVTDLDLVDLPGLVTELKSLYVARLGTLRAA
ncbi:MAG: hypothetical protein QM733_22110 [Ilumatobacteraceae bacterium]